MKRQWIVLGGVLGSMLPLGCGSQDGSRGDNGAGRANEDDAAPAAPYDAGWADATGDARPPGTPVGTLGDAAQGDTGPPGVSGEAGPGGSDAYSGAYTELDPLPVVTTVQSFALAASADDGSPRLGFMFTDPTYRQALLDSNTIENLGGVYDGPNVYVTYQIVGAAWQPYEGRTTPQTYAFSELDVVDNASYYTTTYESLASAIRKGGTGAYALTPAFTTHKAHSIAVPAGSDTLYAIVAQEGTPGLTFSSLPIVDFGVTYPDDWVNLATLDSAASTISYPKLVVAGGMIAASYIQGTSAVVRATASPTTVAQATDVPVIGGCAHAVLADIAWDGTYLYVACVDSTYALTVERASLAALTAATFEPVTTFIHGEIDAIDLRASTSGVSLALRQGTAVRVYAHVTDASPAFDAAMPGNIDLASTARGLVLSVCDFAGDRTLRTFVSP